jgi:PAS domain S-box-containing protein
MKATPPRRRRAKAVATKVARKKKAASRPEPITHEQQRLFHELEVHQIELELQNRTMRETQGSLEDSRAKYAELYDYSPVGHVTLDSAGVIRELNLMGASLLGKDRRYLHKRPMRSLLAPESRRLFDAHLRACFKSDHPLTVELSVPLADGGLRTLELVSMPAPAAGRAPGSERAICHSALIDISARKDDEARRDDLLRREQEARALAESVSKLKEDFLTIVSHELRTPLAPMMMWIKALRTGGMSDSLRARAIDALDTCLAIQVAMIDDLVDVARGRHGKLRIARRPIDLQSVVGAAIEALAPSAAAKNIAVALEVDPTPTWVAGDPTRLQQVVGNLLSNAIKFTDESGHVALSLRTRGDTVVLTVRDDGQGIEPALLGSIFEPFRQHEDGTVRRHGGLGLGLTIVQQLVAQHEGDVAAQSDGKGRGALFTVTLPGLDVPRRSR